MVLVGSLSEVFPALAILLVFAIAGSVLILRLRKQCKEPPSTSIAFTMDELKKLRDEGSISEEEFTLAMQSIVDLAKGSTPDSQ